MPLGSHKQVLAGVDLLAGRAVRRQAKAYRRGIEPLLKAMRGAKSFDGLQRGLSKTAAKRLDTQGLAESIAEAGTTAALIGQTAATPANVEKSKSRNVETSKRQLGSEAAR